MYKIGCVPGLPESPWQDKKFPNYPCFCPLNQHCVIV